MLTLGMLIVAGCSDAPQFGVVISFEPADLAESIDHLELSLVSTCFEESALGPPPLQPFSTAVLTKGSDMSGLGDVESGEYGLYVRGKGPCGAVAGCVSVVIDPDGDSIFEVPVHPIAAARYDSTVVENGGCGDQGICRVEDGEAVCQCQVGFEYNGETCVTAQGDNETYLSDWRWMSETNFAGFAERDKSYNTSYHNDGRPLQMRRTTYAKGIGVNAASEIRVNLDGRCARFQGLVGIDDETNGMGEAAAEVWLDGERVFQSETMTGTSNPQPIDIDVRDGYELRLVAQDLGDPNNDHVDWAQARVVCEEGWKGEAVASLASHWEWVSASNGLGQAERNESNGGSGAGDGTTITLAGQAYTAGIGVHAPSEIALELASHCKRFQADVGVDDEVTSGGSVEFEIWADDELVFESGAMTASTATKQANLDLIGRSQLRLVVTDAGDGNTGDHADWANARFLCTSGWQGEEVDTYVSDWVFALAESGYGAIERDMTNGNFFQNDGTPITINGDVYPRGIGAHAPSRLWLNLAERCTRFTAFVGIDDDSVNGGSIADARFLVLGDGTPMFTSQIKQFGQPVEAIDLDVTGVTLLQLEVDSLGDDGSWDHADWADAKLRCEPGALGL